MKYIILVVAFSLLLLKTSGQIISIPGTENKTTSVIFQNPIIHWDLGVNNPNIAVSVDESVPKILKLRMSASFVDTTNMLVVTQDELVYSFRINYTDTLRQYVYIIDKKKSVNYETAGAIEKNIKLKKKDSLPDKELVEVIHDCKENILRSEIAKKGKVSLKLKNIFIRNEEMYFYLEIENKSNLSYTIDFYNLYMKSNLKKALKGVTSQDIQMDFDFIEKCTEIPAHHNKSVIMHMKKFTLESDKIGILEIYEKEGGRHLKIRLSNDELLSARNL